MCIRSCSTIIHGATAPSGPGPPHYRGFAIILRHIALDRTPLDKWSTGRKDLYLTTNNTHRRETSIPRRRDPKSHNASKWEGEDTLLRKRGHWNWHWSHLRILLTNFDRWQTETKDINLQAPCVLYIGQAFRYSPENAFYIFNQQIYFIIWYLLDRASLIYII